MTSKREFVATSSTESSSTTFPYLLAPRYLVFFLSTVYYWLEKKKMAETEKQSRELIKAGAEIN